MRNRKRTEYDWESWMQRNHMRWCFGEKNNWDVPSSINYNYFIHRERKPKRSQTLRSCFSPFDLFKGNPNRTTATLLPLFDYIFFSSFPSPTLVLHCFLLVFSCTLQVENFQGNEMRQLKFKDEAIVASIFLNLFSRTLCSSGRWLADRAFRQPHSDTIQSENESKINRNSIKQFGHASLNVSSWESTHKIGWMSRFHGFKLKRNHSRRPVALLKVFLFLNNGNRKKSIKVFSRQFYARQNEKSSNLETTAQVLLIRLSDSYRKISTSLKSLSRDWLTHCTKEKHRLLIKNPLKNFSRIPHEEIIPVSYSSIQPSLQPIRSLPLHCETFLKVKRE